MSVRISPGKPVTLQPLLCPALVWPPEIQELKRYTWPWSSWSEASYTEDKRFLKILARTWSNPKLSSTALLSTRPLLSPPEMKIWNGDQIPSQFGLQEQGSVPTWRYEGKKRSLPRCDLDLDCYPETHFRGWLPSWWHCWELIRSPGH